MENFKTNKTICTSKFIALLVVLVLIIFIGLCQYRKKAELKEEKIKMEQFLREKYGKEFVVDSIDYYHDGLGAPKEIKAIVYPKEDRELKFDVRKFADGEDDAYESIYWELYLNNLWEKQLKEKIQKALNIKAIVTNISGPIVDIKKTLRGKELSIDEASNLYKGELSIRVFCGVFHSGRDGNLSEKDVEQFYQMIETIKDKNFKQISLTIFYIDEQYQNNSEIEFNKYIKYNTGKYKDIRNSILFTVEIKDTKDIKGKNDILKYITKIRG